jgi:hypothetical protein
LGKDGAATQQEQSAQMRMAGLGGKQGRIHGPDSTGVKLHKGCGNMSHGRNNKFSYNLSWIL